MHQRILKFLNFFCLRSYARNENGVAALEMVLFFPILLSLMAAVFDLGQGLVINQKVVVASQVIGDLVTRNEVVDENLIEDIIRAGELALDPYPIATFGYDIASVEFDEDGDPFVLWRVSGNIAENDDAIDSAVGLGAEGEGVVVVRVVYEYDPLFTKFPVDVIEMSELSFLRGRKSPTVTCSDCS